MDPSTLRGFCGGFCEAARQDGACSRPIGPLSHTRRWCFGHVALSSHFPAAAWPGDKGMARTSCFFVIICAEDFFMMDKY